MNSNVYIDQGVSRYRDNRPKFQKMLAKARNGEIDLIVTKSISRFGRNTVNVLKTVRKLKELDVGIIFEEQNINTISGDGEVLLTVLSSLAQEESRSISENNKWSIRKKFSRGEIMINTNRFLGYDLDETGDLVINQKQAVIVRTIYERYLSGKGSFTIAKELNEEEIPTITGIEWDDSAVLNILKNEKNRKVHLPGKLSAKNTEKRMEEKYGMFMARNRTSRYRLSFSNAEANHCYGER